MTNRFLAAALDHMRQKPNDIFCTMVGQQFGASLTWSALEIECRRFKWLYAANGLREGDQVLLFLEFGSNLYGAFLGAMLSGIVPSFMPTLTTRQDPHIFWSSHATLLNKLQPSAIVASDAVFAEMRTAGLSLDGTKIIHIGDLAEPSEADHILVPEDQLALLQHSSGTTGLKKGVALSYAAVTNQLDSYKDSLNLNDTAKIVSWLPLYHDMGLVACCLLPIYCGLSIHHIDPIHWVTRPATLFDALHKQQNTLTWMPNFAFEHLAATIGRFANRYDLSGIKAFINCSEPCRAQSFDRFLAAFTPAGVRGEHLQCCYAMAETTFAVSQTALGATPVRIKVDPDKLGVGQCPIDPNGPMEIIECGAALKDIRIDIYDENNARLPDDTVGEIVLSGDFLFKEYNKEPERTSDRLKNGIYFSNDIGFRHQDRIFVLGRKDDLIIVNGRNLFAHEIEAAITGISGLRAGRSVALSLYNDKTGSGELVVLAERDAENARDEGAVQADVVKVIYSIFSVQPKAVSICNPGALLKTTSGKISRKLNLERYKAALARVQE